MASPPHFHWDFQGINRHGHAVLRWCGFGAERDAQGVELREGMEVLLWEEDEDRDGKPALMVVDAKARFDAEKGYWTAVQDMGTFRHLPLPDRRGGCAREEGVAR